MRTINKILVICTAVFLYSCDDILEDDISDDTIQITYPMNNQVIESNVANFQWMELDGADKYRVQVFSSNQSIVLDSVVGHNNLSYSLAPGSYQWRVRGENSAYTSSYSFSANFSMIASDDLTNQQVILSNPSNNSYTNNSSVTFSWETLAAADSYTFQLINISDGESLYNEQTGLTENTVTLTSTVLTEDGQYQWKVKAVNAEGSTPFASRSFFLDKTAPNQPVNNLPEADFTENLNQPVDFSWSIPSDNGTVQSPLSYTIQFSNSIGFSTIISQTSNLTTNTFQQTFTVSGDYYWRIRAKDSAGNTGISSTPFKLTID